MTAFRSRGFRLEVRGISQRIASMPAAEMRSKAKARKWREKFSEINGLKIIVGCDHSTELNTQAVVRFVGMAGLNASILRYR